MQYILYIQKSVYYFFEKLYGFSIRNVKTGYA